ncbi:helicase-associated domain-containing protein [Microbacterium nymphoidis]|uniref:helicase-associated domain-containing protein n=1 Tax=Microbacterium nymphoidis TaxID=2898586 RepID=UPI001E44543A|nr:helicase-associated domain-containing protein [Microbacterium nymphoidis]MCD2499342.1 helicase-associated domain-containing protein [Microbacterium nymphoidis]
MSLDARGLAGALAALSDTELRAVLRARGASPTASWRDPFDAAEALLEPSSVRAALATLTAAEASDLHSAVMDGTAATDVSGTLRALALVDGGAPYPSVAEVVRSLPDVPAPSDAVAVAQDSPSAAEHAFTAAGQLADLLLTSYVRPLAVIGTGSIAAGDRKRVVEDGLVRDPDDIDDLVWIASRASLLRLVEREWLVSTAATGWLRAGTAERWHHLATTFRDRLPLGLRRGQGWAPPEDWQQAYPWNADWHASTWLHRASILGLIDARTLAPTPWALNDDEASRELLAAHLPHEVDRVYLQNDLSVIAPGPLAPALDIRLRTMSDRESHAQASTYRFTPDSLQRALAQGETEDSVRDFLGDLSLTGIPQPLSYLITETVRRHGAITVGADPVSGRTRVRVSSDALREMLSIDQTLRPLGLLRDGDDLVSRVGRDSVARALADAHYPVAAVNAAGEPEPLQAGRLAPDDATDLITPDLDPLVARLRSADAADLESAWMQRELEAAVHARALLHVTVSLPDGAERTFTLEASGIGGGRLRGLDRAADVERVLPISHITHLAVAS